MDIIEDNKHDALASDYQQLEVDRLNDTLKECGVADAKLRRKICEGYFCKSGDFLDGCWFGYKDVRYRPGIYFAELDQQDHLTGKILLPDPEMGTHFHECAHGAASWLFEAIAEAATEIETGDAR